VQLSSADYHIRKEGGHFNREEFHLHPERYQSDFAKFTKVGDILLAGAFWNPKAPALFTREDMLDKQFKLKLLLTSPAILMGPCPVPKNRVPYRIRFMIMTQSLIPLNRH